MIVKADGVRTLAQNGAIKYQQLLSGDQIVYSNVCISERHLQSRCRRLRGEHRSGGRRSPAHMVPIGQQLAWDKDRME